MTKASTTEVHERRHRRIIDRDELLSLVSSTVCNELGLGTKAGITVKVKFDDGMEGAPAYRVGIKAVVDVVEDLLPSAAPSPAEPGPGGGSKV